MPSKLKAPFLKQSHKNPIIDVVLKPYFCGITSSFAAALLSDSLHEYLALELISPNTSKGLLVGTGFLFGYGFTKICEFVRFKLLQRLFKYQGWILDHGSTQTKVLFIFRDIYS